MCPNFPFLFFCPYLLPAKKENNMEMQIKTNSLSDIQMSVFEFLTDKKAENLASGTLVLYKDKLVEFVNFCKTLGVGQVLDITPDTIRGFILSLQDKGHNSGGIHIYYRVLKTFFLWYESEYEPTNWKNPIRKVKAPKLIVEPIEGVGIENFHLLLNACDKTRFGLRNSCILFLLLDTGVRAQELLDINIEDIDFTDSSILIRMGKGRKPRSVFFGIKTKKILRKYLKTVNRSRGALFSDRDGSRLTYSGLRGVIRKLSQKAGIKEEKLHNFRRTFALEQLTNGVDVYTIARLMGHTSLQVLSRYLRQTKGNLRNSYKSIADAK